MIRCAPSKLLTAASRLRRVHVSSTKPPIFDEIRGENVVSEPNFTPPLEDQRIGKGDVQPAAEEAGLAAQQPISTAKPVTRRELPISPLMDPEVISAKEKHRTRKSAPSKNPTDLQKELAKNPYALALATPMRICRLSLVTLPRYFLQDFNIALHPETKESWWIPRSLARQYSPPSGKGDVVVEETIEQDDGEEAMVLEDGTEDMETHSGEDPKANELGTDDVALADSKSAISSSPDKRLPSSPRVGPNSYVLARHPALEGLTGSAVPRKMRILTSAYPLRLRERGNFAIFDNAKVRPDIGTFVLELLRRRTVEELEYLVKLGAYIRPCDTWQDATMPSRQAGAILWTGSIQGVTGGIEMGPPEFATIDIGTSQRRKVPVHNLEMLLGNDHLQRLRGASSFFNKELLIIKKKNNSARIQMKLWKLQGYLAEHPEFLAAEPARDGYHPSHGTKVKTWRYEAERRVELNNIEDAK